MRQIPAAAIAFIKLHEACKLTVYLDSAGVPTSGYGHVTKLPVDSTITQEQADADLEADLPIAGGRLASVVHPAIIDELTDNQYSALISFVFNVGSDPGWTIWKELNAARFDQIPAQLMRFVNAGSPPRKLNGLVNRRAAEVALWSTDEPGSISDELPSSTVRAMPTPPTAVNPTPAPMQPKMIAGALTAVTTGSAVVTNLTQQAQPYAGKAHVIDTVLTGLAIAGFGLAVVTGLLMWLSHRTQNR